MTDAGPMLPFLLQVMLLVAVAAAIGFAVAHRLGRAALTRVRAEQAQSLTEATQARQALADELAQARGRLSALSSEAERTRALAAGFRRRADELEADLRDALARSTRASEGGTAPPAG